MHERTRHMRSQGSCQSAANCCDHISREWGTFSFTLARAISSLHFCSSASSRDFLRVLMFCWSSSLFLLIFSTSAGVNFWFCSWTCSASRSCFRDARWLTVKKWGTCWTLRWTVVEIQQFWVVRHGQIVYSEKKCQVKLRVFLLIRVFLT